MLCRISYYMRLILYYFVIFYLVYSCREVPLVNILYDKTLQNEFFDFQRNSPQRNGFQYINVVEHNGGRAHHRVDCRLQPESDDRHVVYSRLHFQSSGGDLHRERQETSPTNQLLHPLVVGK